MKKKILYPLISFMTIFILHAIFSISKSVHISKKWVQIEDINFLWLYIKQQDYLLGISYALAGAFIVYAFLKFLKRQRGSTVGLMGGVTLMGALYLLGCFLIGCCGSPMLVIYLGLFGPRFLGFTKPLILIFTITSIIISYFWMRKKSKSQDTCCKISEVGMELSTMTIKDAIDKIHAELQKGIALVKCKKCGCMKETLESLHSSLLSLKDSSDLLKNIEQWLMQIEPIEYACLGCKHCFPAVAMNIFNQVLSSTLEVKEKSWPVVAGEYFAFCDGPDCPVAVSTLASYELAEKLAKMKPRELCIVGKTETENIGIDKVIKNIITNPTIHFLLLAGKDSIGHQSGKTLLAIKENGVDEHMRVIGSAGKHPILKNVSCEEVEAFRKQVEIIDMLGCEDTERIIERIKIIAKEFSSSEEAKPVHISQAPVVQANESMKVEMDKAGYFVIIPQPMKGIIIAEHYSYDNRLLRVIEGKDARSIYSTIVDNGWITNLSHAAYLGNELSRAELSLKLGFKYTQDGA